MEPFNQYTGRDHVYKCVFIATSPDSQCFIRLIIPEGLAAGSTLSTCGSTMDPAVMVTDINLGSLIIGDATSCPTSGNEGHLDISSLAAV